MSGGGGVTAWVLALAAAAVTALVLAAAVTEAWMLASARAVATEA